MKTSRLTVDTSICFLLLIIPVITEAENDTITSTKPLKDGEFLVSSGGNFKLGFFSPTGRPNNRYVGIWYNKIPLLTAVWVANRATPLSDTSGTLQISNSHSTLVILNKTKHIIWSTNYTKSSTLNQPIAQLLDSGNLVIRDDENSENLIWQSFDHPCDIHLPGMKLGLDLATGLDRQLTSWTSSDNPAPGNFIHKVDPRGFPELVVMKGNIKQYRYGPWNGLRLSGIPGMKPNNHLYTYWFVINQTEIYYSYKLLNTSVITHRFLNPSGMMQRVIWNEQTQGWVMYLTGQVDSCDSYATCGAFGSCNVGNSPQCECIKGFEPRHKEAWDSGDWSHGCVRRTALSCSTGNEDGFWKLSNIKPPETEYSWYNFSMNLEECKMMCLKNCSCSAYSSLDVRAGGSGCLLWFGHLVDIKEFNGNGQDLFIKLASSEIGTMASEHKSGKWITIGCTLLAALLLLGLGSVLWVKKKKQGRKEDDLTDSDLPLLDFNVIAQATGNFSHQNEIGKGGFGVVYKGRLQGGQDIAVKKILKESSQGLDEFKNEVICIAKLQHRNLVKLLGCSIQADERLLVYEYVPNKGLDSFIFEQAQKTSLDWPKRLNIINGIARGLLYLHQDSRLRIVHRDLKASNVLLDHDLDPKISDFGTARCFYGTESLAKTRRVIGTYGYMSPEYAVDGIFSTKSDVFSFGVLVLEIISGMRNRGFTHQDHHFNLLGHAWRLFYEGEPMKLVSTQLNNVKDDAPIIVRSIHVALLCVQQRSEDRPSMSTVVVMLSSEGELPPPKQPGFFTQRNLEEINSVSSKDESASANEMSITLLDGR